MVRSSQKVQVVERCLAVLELLAGQAESVGVSTLARQIGLSKASTHRICQTLLDRQYLEQDSQTGQYRPGWRLYELCSRLLSQCDFARAARPIMRQMVQTSRENAFAAVMIDGQELLVCEEMCVANPIRPQPLLGWRAPLPEAPGGLLCMAGVAADQLEPLVDRILLRFGKQIQRTRQQIVDEVRTARGQRYGVQAGLPHPDVSVVCSPAVDRRGEVAGVVGFCHPTIRVQPVDQQNLGAICSQAAQVLSAALGHAGA